MAEVQNNESPERGTAVAGNGGNFPGNGEAPTAAARFIGSGRLLEYVSGLLGAFIHPAPVRADDGNRAPWPASHKPALPAGAAALQNGQTAGDRTPGPPLRESGFISRAPRISRAGESRRAGFAILGGSLDARLSHTPGGFDWKTGGMRP